MTKNKLTGSGIVYSTDPAFKLEEEIEATETPGPAQQRLRVKLDTKHRAGKAVTLVEGFIGRSADVEELGRKLRSFCGTGGSVKENGIIVQGDNRDKVLTWLQKNGYSQSKKSG